MYQGWMVRSLLGRCLWGMCFLAWGLAVVLPGWAGKVLNDACVTRPFNHHIWHEVVSEFSDREGRVNFTGLRAYPKRLNQYLQQLETVSPVSEPDYFPTRDDVVSYWINAYNAVALRLILDAYPVEQLAQIPDLAQNPRYYLGGTPYTLEELKAQLLQAAPSRQTEALALAITTYRKSDPPLLHQAYRADILEEQLITQREHVKQFAGTVWVPPRCEDPLQLVPFLATWDTAELMALIQGRLSEDEREAWMAGCWGGPQGVQFNQDSSRLRDLR